jgi:hypothetical protein
LVKTGTLLTQLPSFIVFFFNFIFTNTLAAQNKPYTAALETNPRIVSPDTLRDIYVDKSGSEFIKKVETLLGST